jgi:hypothetical protein
MQSCSISRPKPFRSTQHGASLRRASSCGPCQHAAAPRHHAASAAHAPAETSATSSNETSSSAWQPVLPSLPALGTLACTLLLSGSAYAAPAPQDSAAIGKCLLSNCQSALAGCLADGGCLQNLVCLNACNDAPDVTACQIRCGDLYADKAIDVFNSCAVSSKKCVPQRLDEGLYPVPPDCALDRGFDLSKFTGRWYIAAGLNPLFDIFDCQVGLLQGVVLVLPGCTGAVVHWCCLGALVLWCTGAVALPSCRTELSEPS